MAIFDIHGHIGSVNSLRAPWDFLNITAEDLLKRMDKCGVAQTCLFAVPQPSLAVLSECQRHNDVVAQTVRRYPDRFIGICVTTPHTGDDMGVGEVKRTVEKYGFRGVKFQSNRMGFDLRVDVLGPIFETCIDYNIPVLIHTGDSRTSPDRVGYLALAYPKLTVVMLHAGGRSDFYYYAPEVARLTPNIVLETSGVGSGAIRHAVKMIGAKRLVFGSDSPYGPLEGPIGAVKNAGLTPEEEEAILNLNARALIRL